VGADRALVGADRWSALLLTPESAHCMDPPACRRAHSCTRRRRVGGPHRWWPLPALRAVLAGAATAPWRLARCCPFFRPDRIHAWR